MNNVYSGSEEKWVKTVVLYAKKTGDSYLYTDAVMTQTISRVDLLNLCNKGLALVSFDGAIYTPILFKDSGTVVTVTIATINTTAFAVKDLTSKEPTPAA